MPTQFLFFGSLFGDRANTVSETLETIDRASRIEDGSAFPNKTKRSYSDEKISLELTLFDQSWVANKKPKITMGEHDSSSSASSTYVNRGLVSNVSFSEKTNRKLSNQEVSLSPGEKENYYIETRQEDKEAVGFSTPKLAVEENRWKIKREITKSNLKVPTRLVVPRTLIKKYVLDLIQRELIDKIQSADGARVEVLDKDTQSLIFLDFKRWPRGDYVFKGDWNKEFMERRELKEGDEVGFYWDPDKSRFNFSVLKRASSV